MWRVLAELDGIMALPGNYKMNRDYLFSWAPFCRVLPFSFRSCPAFVSSRSTFLSLSLLSLPSFSPLYPFSRLYFFTLFSCQPRPAGSTSTNLHPRHSSQLFFSSSSSRMTPLFLRQALSTFLDGVCYKLGAIFVMVKIILTIIHRHRHCVKGSSFPLLIPSRHSYNFTLLVRMWVFFISSRSFIEFSVVVKADSTIRVIT